MSSARVNLAPEVYQASQRAKQKRQLTTISGVAVGVVCVAILVVAVVILAGQKIYISTLNGQIHDKQDQIAQMTDLPKAATAADHLASLNHLTSQRKYLTRLFAVTESTVPQGVSFTSITLNEANVMEVSATAKSYALATKLAKALEASGVTLGLGASPQATPYFSNVQLGTVDGDTSSGATGVNFKITAQVAPEVESAK